MSTLKVDTVRPVTTDADLALQGDASGAGVTGAKVFGDGSLGADSITDLAGTGAPDFPNGLVLASNATGGSISGVTLDDYEEGTWTPTMSSGSVTVNVANYIKIGRQVYLQAHLVDITDSSTSAVIIINDLPFDSSSSQQGLGSVMLRYLKYSDFANLIQINPYIGPSGNSISFFMSKNTPGGTPYNWEQLEYQDTAGVDWDMILNITYLTD